MGRGFWIYVLGAMLTGCASYSPLVLNEQPNLRPNLKALVVAPVELPLRELGSRQLNLRRPLDIDDVATIAVLHNPDLKAARAKVGVARAQAFAAGLLPDPQFSFDYGFLVAGPGTTNSIMTGLAQDILPLLTLSTRKAAAEANERSVELDLLWKEWLTVSQARMFFIKAIALEQQLRILQRSRELFEQLYKLSSEAMKRGDQTLPTVTPDLVALSSAESQLYDLNQVILKNKHDLNALLGLLPEARLPLSNTAQIPAIDARKLMPLLADLSARRPDLLALKAGYDAQEEKVRQAIVEQFPKLNIGSNLAKDTSAVYTRGLAVTVSLPVFDRNQGRIAIEHATRQQLHDEYQARLDAAYSAAARLVSELRLLERQYASARESLTQLRDAAATAEQAYQARNLDERTYIDLRTALLAKELAAAKLRQAILEQRVTLQTLIGSNLPNALRPLSGTP
jgi:outer membrane protein TolC